MLVNVCPDDVFWTANHFGNKLGMVMQHHEPKCQAEKWVQCLQCQGYNENSHNQNMTISLYFLNYWSICKPTVEKLDSCSQGQGHSEGSKCQWMFVQMISSEMQNILLPSMAWWCSIMSQNVMQKQKMESSCDQNITLFFTISAELLILWQPNMVWWYIIVSQSAFWKKDYCI